MKNSDRECKLMTCVDNYFDWLVERLPFPLQIPTLIVFAAPVVIVMWWQGIGKKKGG